MNSSKLSDESFLKKDLSEKNKPPEKKKTKNIREIYLNAVNNNINARGSKIKYKSISNIKNPQSSASSSQYLENEYNLVKKIINATKALEKLKSSASSSSSSHQTNNLINNDALNANNLNSLAQLRQLSALSSSPSTNLTPSLIQSPSTAAALLIKSPDEFYQELLSLKKQVKLLQNNETISKSKIEYYENEIAKKDQEIVDLLELRKAEEARAAGDSKSDLTTMVSNLKLKAFKLEIMLKRKDRELNKLENEVKTTNVKELKQQNERLKVELSRALMNESKILDSEDIGQLFSIENKSNEEIQLDRKFIDSLSNKNELFKQNVSRMFRRHVSDSQLNKFNTDIHHKIVLKGSLKEQLAQLDLRETELLSVIAQLIKELDALKLNSRHHHNHQHHHHHQQQRASRIDLSQENLREKEKLNAIRTIQSVMKGHLERSNSIKRDRQSRERVQREREDMLERENEILLNRRQQHRSESPTPRQYSPRSPRNSATPPYNNNRRHSDDDDDDINHHHNRYNARSPQYDSRGRRRQRRDGDEISSGSEENGMSREDVRKLIKNRTEAETTDGGCCSPWRHRSSESNKNSKK